MERIIEAELVGAPVPDDLTMEEFADADTSAQVLKWLNRTYVSRNESMCLEMAGCPQG